MAFTDTSNLRVPPLGRRLRLGFVGGGRGGLVGNWHFAGARLSNHWEIVAGALSSRPENAAASARDWCIAPERSYTALEEMVVVGVNTNLDFQYAIMENETFRAGLADTGFIEQFLAGEV